MEQLNERQQKVFDYIRQSLDKNGFAPSVREIANAVGYSSPSTVQYILDELEELGYIERDPNLKRTIRIRLADERWARHIPILGTVAAGKPLYAVECIEGFLHMAIGKAADEYFALRVKGDSMINAAILEGDIVIVKRTPVAENGDIVVALIDDEATVKTFYKEEDHFRLQPENDYYDPIIVDELVILGKVKTVVRDY